MRAWAWHEDKLVEDPPAAELARFVADEQTFVWIDLKDPSDAELGRVAKLLGLHHLVVEDIREANERAKVDTSQPDYVHVVMFWLSKADGRLDATEIDLVLGRQFLLSAHNGPWDPRSSHEFRGGVEPILKEGADFVLWALVDDIVDSYFPLFDRLADEIDELEDLIVTTTGRGTVERIFDLKRSLLTIRRVTSPQREIFNQLTNRKLAFIGDGHLIYFRDVYDHLIRLTDELDTFQDRLTGSLDAYLSTVNNNLSEIMKRLTAVTVTLAFIAAVGGLFGMSEAGPAFLGQEAPGFWFVVGLSVAIGAVAIVWLRRIGWL